MLRFFWIKCVFNYLQFKLNPKLTLRLKHTESVSPTTHLQFLKVKASARINFGVNLWRKTLFDSGPARKFSSLSKVSTILRHGAIVIRCPTELSRAGRAPPSESLLGFLIYSSLSEHGFDEIGDTHRHDLR